MKALYWVALFAVAALPQAAAQPLSGFVLDSLSLEPLPYATITWEEGRKGVVANEQGFFSLDAGRFPAFLCVRYVGFREQCLSVEKPQPAVRILLAPELELPAVELAAPRPMRQAGASLLQMDIRQIRLIPALAGETDPLKAMGLLPGLSTGIEGTANLLIRGGNADQSQYLLDGGPVYNASHLGGFLSAVPPQGVRAVTAYKGGIPARFGGRLGGLIDVDVKQGNRRETEGELSIGTATLAAALEGPAGRKGAFFIAGRTAYPSLALSLAQSGKYEPATEGEKTNIYIYDFLAKGGWEFGKTKVSVSAFASGDHGLIQEANESGFDMERRREIDLQKVRWNNLLANLRLQRVLHSKVFLRLDASFSRYRYSFEEANNLFQPAGQAGEPAESRHALANSFIEDLGLNGRLDYFLNSRHTLRAGGALSLRRFSARTEESLALNGEQAAFGALALGNRGIEYGLFIEDEWSPAERLHAYLGLRFSGLLLSGSGFSALEPRLGLEYNLRPWLAVYGALDISRQYVHLLTVGGIGLPNDLWVSAGAAAPPQMGRQWSAGLRGSWAKAKLSWQVEAYHRSMKRLIELQLDRRSFFGFEQSWEEAIYSNGAGRAYGLEILLRRDVGRLQGFLAYTLSRSERQFPGLNNGRAYPFSFDRPHDLAASGVFQLSSRWSLSANWVYQSGRAITLPVARSNDYFIFTDYNNGRFPDYHRLDLGATYSWRGRKRKNLEHQLNFSIYNAYNRQNVFAYSFSRRGSKLITFDENGNPVVVYDVTVLETFGQTLFPIIPGISYHLKF
ncbi:MAG: TonB-dependent receptor [Phaeodactylibacter sp.]|nr:TonB-dependent receptor [Phaeodactylibacter sp.]